MPNLFQPFLIDEFIISVIPVFVGNGTRLFKDGRPEQKLELVSTKHFDKGLTQLHYKRAICSPAHLACIILRVALSVAVSSL